LQFVATLFNRLIARYLRYHTYTDFQEEITTTTVGWKTVLLLKETGSMLSSQFDNINIKWENSIAYSVLDKTFSVVTW
jgi:hypothetical protein